MGPLGTSSALVIVAEVPVSLTFISAAQLLVAFAAALPSSSRAAQAAGVDIRVFMVPPVVQFTVPRRCASLPDNTLRTMPHLQTGIPQEDYDESLQKEQGIRNSGARSRR